jgi:ubiquinone/menaquinone biosynthesis C-methylase UbiE
MLLRGNLALAPMAKLPEYVLDVGTGTGIWAVEYGDYSKTLKNS